MARSTEQNSTSQLFFFSVAGRGVFLTTGVRFMPLWRIWQIDLWGKHFVFFTNDLWSGKWTRTECNGEKCWVSKGTRVDWICLLKWNLGDFNKSTNATFINASFMSHLSFKRSSDQLLSSQTTYSIFSQYINQYSPSLQNVPTSIV